MHAHAPCPRLTDHVPKNPQVDYVKGFGKVAGPSAVHVQLNEGGESTLAAKNILIATGSEVAPLPTCPVDNKGGRIVDSTGALELKTIPKTMAVIGGARWIGRSIDSEC